MTGDMQEEWKNTHSGMAYFSGTGPAGKTCRECVHVKTEGRYAASNPKRSRQLKPVRCREYARRMMINPNKAPTFSAKANSCHCFEQSNNPPPPQGDK